MPLGRHRSKPGTARVLQAALERLETRQLLTALIDGTFQGTGTFYDGQSIFEYQQADDSIIRISVTGNITAEFIGGVPTFTRDVALVDLVPATAEGADGVDLFSIYVVKSDIDCTISIAEVPSLTTPNRPMNPFAGGPTIRVQNAFNGQSETFPLDDGAAYIGARTPSSLPTPLNDIPLIFSTQKSFGMRPASVGDHWAGLEVAPGNDLGRFYLGGTITGIVDVHGSMETFYAGNILTGDAEGMPRLQTARDNFIRYPFGVSMTTPTKNFRIAKDIRNLISANSFGTITLTEPENLEEVQYKTGFDLYVGGRIGQIRAGDSFLGQATVKNEAGVRGPGIAQREIERRGQTLPPGDASYFDPTYYGNDIGLGMYAFDTRFFNDTFDTAQFLGTAWSQALNSEEVIQLTGMCNDYAQPGIVDVDYYAVPLLAGQKMEVQFNDIGGLGTVLRLGIFDPDGRLIATDYWRRDQFANVNKVFRITADRPGAYRIAISTWGDSNFNGIADDTGGAVLIVSGYDYELRVRKIADIALGGLIAQNHIATMDLNGKSIEVLRGDLGEVRAGLTGDGTLWSFSNPWYVPVGNVRAVEASNIGIRRSSSIAVDDGDFFPASGPDFIVRKGSIGLIRTTDATTGAAVLTVNDSTPTWPSDSDDLSLVDPRIAVGKEIQLVDAAGDLEGSLLSNGAIGMIRAQLVGLFNPPVWMANVDKRGSDGIIDLIDVTSNLGGPDTGGPAISTGPNGNVRYMRVLGTVYRDIYFGSSQNDPTNYEPGETARLTDDSGTQVTLTPIPLIRDITAFPQQYVDPGSLSVLTYPIRGSTDGSAGGQVILRVTVNSGIAAGRGLQVESGSRGPIGGVEIGEVVINSVGTTTTFNYVTRSFTTDLGAQPADVLLTGKSTVDVFSIVCAGGLSSVINTTSGEVVNIEASDISLIEAETVGLARQSTGAAVYSAFVLNNVVPFSQQRNLVQAIGPAGGNIVTVRSRRGVGNLLAAGNIGTVIANYDGKNVPGVYEGIVAPIMSAGDIVSVSIGEGVLPSGTGALSFAGIYANGIIDSVTGSGLGVDIRGNIIASGNSPFVSQIDPVTGQILTSPTYDIGTIQLRNGAIIGAKIANYTSIAMGFDTFLLPLQVSDGGETVNQPVFDIARIRLDGVGGIIGSYIDGADIGPIEINGGFGVITSRIRSVNGNTIQGTTTDGLGVRSSLIEGGAKLNQVICRGTGKRVATTYYTPSVRLSEQYSIDPYFGYEINQYTDLHKVLGTSAAAPKRKGLSDTGSIEDTQIVGAREVNRIEANRIVARTMPVRDPSTGQLVTVTIGNPLYPLRFSFGNVINSINVRQWVDGLSLTAGGINSFVAGGDVTRSLINVSGRIRRIESTGGALRGTTTIKATGPDGQIDLIKTRRSLYATINASQDIRNVIVGTDLGSRLLRSGKNIHTLDVKKSILSGANVEARKTLYNLIVGGDLKANATVTANNIDNQQFGGQIIGDIIIR